MQVFKHIMAIPANKPCKGGKLGWCEFHEKFGQISASIRYDTLVICGKHVTVRWADGQMTLSGSYGKGHSLL